MSEFGGFRPQTIFYLKALGQNNRKSWFDANRRGYEEHYIEPAKNFITAIAEPLKKIAPNVHAEPYVNGSIFRINRDIRFSKDKTPYKDHLDMWFWEGERKSAVSGFFFRLTATNLILGAGAHMLRPEKLTTLREKVAAASSRKTLVEAVQSIETAGLDIKGAHYKKLPKGFEADDAHAERFLKHKAIWTDSTEAHPKALGTPEFVGHCMDTFKKCAPLHKWLVAELG